MDTPPESPSPKTQKWAGAANKANKVIMVIAIIVVGMIFLGQKLMMGKRYKVTEKESVNYSEKATEEDAKKLGEVLKAEGYFSGKNEKDVLLKKEEKEGTVVSFVGDWNAKDETVKAGFTQMGEKIE
jgi:hypothetical protein